MYGSRLANKLLLTPFDDKCSVPSEVAKMLTPREFFEQCYVRPEFIGPESVKDLDDGDETATDELAQKVQSDFADIARIREDAYEYFKNWLKDFKDTKVYTISGNAGTGKTTLVNYFKFKEKENTENIDWIIIDMFRSVNPIRWIGDYKTNVPVFKKAYGKVYGIVLRTISEILFKDVDADSGDVKPLPYEKAYMQLCYVVENYKKYYEKSNPAGSTFLDNIKRRLSMRASLKERVNSVATYCAEFFSCCDSPRDKIYEALDALLLLSRCNCNDNAKRFIVVFDNFERFINDDEIYNKQVDDIRRDLNYYAKGIESHKGVFKFVMSIRSSTIRMCRASMQASDAIANNLNIAMWYNCDDIIAKKREWYKSRVLNSKAKNLDGLEGYDLVSQIVGDQRVTSDNSKTGLKLYIDPLFNYNKRLIIDFISGIIEKPSNKIAIEKYRELWNEDSSLSRFAARSIIRGLILETLEKQDNLFSHMKTHSLQTKSSGNGIARRILTILYDYQRDFENDLMPFSYVLYYYYRLDNKDQAKAHWDNMSEEDRTQFAEALFYMNSYNRRSNDWVQFLDIQIQNQEIDTTIAKSQDLEILVSENIRNITLHILPAGVDYLTYIVPSFEFFAMRYCKNYHPLFTLIPEVKDMRELIKKNSDVRRLPCYQMIENTTNYALGCRSQLQENGDIPLFVDRFNEQQYHSVRIYNHHKGYLEKFVEYIRKRYIISRKYMSMSPVEKKYDELCVKIEDLIESY